ncbi:unnamed protein product [Durusdinium trenchii]|uniref:Uncharacterized protein n=1 Tax=Durusdinium trenchii TaxID=1381693 RepID=A0ABP0NQP5_9DINO
MLPCVLGLLSLGAVHGAPKPYVGIYNASCWGPGFSQEMCCNQAFSERGMAACWVDGYSFEYCCPPPLGVFRSSGAYVGHQPHIYDKGFGPALVKFFQSRRATTVLDLGAGAGWYVQTLRKSGIRAGCADGNPSVRMVSEKRCWHADLSEDWDLGQRWSWVMSIEVAEHVPKAFEKTYVDNLDRHSCEGLVISWAPPFQAAEGARKAAPQERRSHCRCSKRWFRTKQRLRQGVSNLPGGRRRPCELEDAGGSGSIAEAARLLAQSKRDDLATRALSPLVDPTECHGLRTAHRRAPRVPVKKRRRPCIGGPCPTGKAAP